MPPRFLLRGTTCPSMLATSQRAVFSAAPRPVNSPLDTTRDSVNNLFAILFHSLTNPRKTSSAGVNFGRLAP